jgi:phospholipid-binding lipoprotein MlaA
MTVMATASRRYPSAWRALLLIGLLAGCSSIQTQRRDWSGYHGPGAEYFHVKEIPPPLGIRDPAQPFNRGVFAANDWFVDWIGSPLGAAWRFVFRPTVREHIAQAGVNLAFPTRALNQLGQGKVADAGTEAARFLINTTVGLLGFFDPASAWGFPPPRAEDTGQTLYAAGWKDSRYLFLPLSGPNTVRDGVGLIGDALTNIGFWLGGVELLMVFPVNRGADLVLEYEQFEATQPDPYELSRLGWSLLRAAELNDVPISPTELREGKVEQTLQVLFMAPSSPAFFRTATHGKVVVPSTGRMLPFSYWLQEPPEPPADSDGVAPLLYVLPGLGGHRLSDQTLALVESALLEGWSVVTLSGAMHPEFMAAAGTAPAPGFAPLDSRDVRGAVDAIDGWLQQRYPGRLGPRALLGISLGAFHALLIAAEQTREPSDGHVHFEAFGAAAPPVSTEYGLTQLDALYNEPMNWPAESRQRRSVDLLRRVAVLAQGKLRPGQPLPFSESEARYLVGLAYRLTLVDAIWDSQQRHDQGVLLTPRDARDRGPAYVEILDYSWREYFYAFVLPWLRAENLVVDDTQALELCDLRSVAPLLAGNQTVHVFVSDNDFLRRAEDQDLLIRLFGRERVHETRGGGHFGNGWRPEVRVMMMRELKYAISKAAQ